MRDFNLEIIDTHRCFLPVDSFQNGIKFHEIKQFCLYLTLYFIPLTLKPSKSLVISHVITFFIAFCLYQEI